MSFLSPQRGSFWPLHPVWRNKNYFLSYRFLDTQASRTKTTFNWKLFGVDKFLNILRSIFHALKQLMVKGPVILSYAVGCLLMTQSCLSLTEHISFCGLTIKIVGSMYVFWSCNLFFVVFLFARTCRAQIK